MYNSPFNNTMVWWEGIVENRQDPLQIGRVQVRIFGIHTDNLQQLPSSELHWMSVMTPTTSASNSGVGITPNLIEGTSVVGFFRDGDSKQDGIVIGSINGIPQQSRRLDRGFSDNRTNLSAVPKKPSSIDYSNGAVITESNALPYPNRIDEPDTSRLARNDVSIGKDTTIINKKKAQASQVGIKTASGTTFSEPSNQYKTVYPYNHVTETESGHVLEFDDTPSHERIHLYHRSGSNVEMLANGDVINKSAKDEYNIIHGSQYEHISSTRHLTIDGEATLYVNAKGASKGLSVKIGAGGDINITVESGNVNLNVTGDVSQKVSGDFVVDVGGRFAVTASRIDLN